jgi:S-DNA-T family DNA segregation ATPase FtsK/SpoIIIE
MQPVPFTRRTRTLLSQLATLVSERAKTAADAARVLEGARDVAMRAHKEATSAAEGEAKHARALINQEHSGRIDALKRSHQDQLQRARAQFDADVREFRAKTSAIEQGAQRKAEDGHWLVDTMIESGEGKLKKEFDSVRRSLQSLIERTDQLASDAQASLEKFGHRPLPAAPQDVTHWALPDDTAGMRDKCEELVRTGRSYLEELQGKIKPRMLGPATFVFVPMLFIAAGAVTAAIIMGQPYQKSALIGAGAGTALSVVIFVPLRMVLRGRVPAVAEKLSKHIAETRATIDHALRLIDSQLEDRKQHLRKQAEQEVAKNRLEVNQLRYEAYRRKTEEEPVFILDHENTIVELRARIEAESNSAIAARDTALAKVERMLKESLADARSTLDRELATAQATHDHEIEQATTTWREGMQQGYAEADTIRAAAAATSAPWDSPRWTPFPPAQNVPAAVSIGALQVDLASLPGGLPTEPAFALPGSAAFELPISLDLRERGSVLIQAGADARQVAIATLRNIMLRLLAAIPPAKTRFTIIDPVGLGESFAAFMHLADYDQQIVGDRIWTEPRHIEQKLSDLTEHMETVIQKYLRNEYATIQEYNEKAGEIAEPYRFLVIADFPAGFSEAAAKRLASIIASGPRCGVFTLIAMDTRQRPPAWVPLADIERGSLSLVFKGGKLSWNEEQFNRWPITLEAPPSDAIFTRLIHDTGKLAKDSGRVQVPFETVAPTPPELWTRSAAEEIRVPIGRTGATKIQHLALGRGTAQHALIAGRTGSGKSTLLHAIITSAALWYSPSEVELYLVDFKKGVEFKTYATHQLPHARVIAVESEREFGLSVLRRLDSELTRRGELYRNLGVQDLAGYRRMASSPSAPAGTPKIMPRVLLIVDEFQEFFVADDKIAQEASLLLDRLVRQGRAFGVHVILGSQTIGGVYSLARSTIGQMAVRVALQCSEADSYLIMSEDNAAARLLSRPGEAIYNDASGLVEGNSPFQVVWLPDEKREKFLDTVHDRPSEVPTPIVFEGNVPSDLATNPPLAKLIAEPATARTTLPRAWLGDAISIKDPTATTFKRQSSANLLIVGQQDLPSMAVTLSSVVGLAAWARGQNALLNPASPAITILDGSVMEDGSSSPFEVVGRALPGLVARAGVRECDAAIAELYADLVRRQAPDAGEAPTRFLVVYGLQRFRSLRRAEEDFGFGGGGEGEATKPDQQFMNLVREGPALGIHTIMWINTTATLERSMDRRALREFDGRVLFQMSQTDSSFLIDGPAAANLGQHRALAFSEETGVIEKFRPYALPDPAWFETTLQKLAAGS